MNRVYRNMRSLLVNCQNEVFEIKNILKAANFKPSVPAIFGSVPMKDKEITIDLNHNGRRERETVQGSGCQTQTKNKRQYCKYVMLSFANDGNTIAMNVASVLRATTNRKGLPIGVVMLCENDHILANPGLIITDILSKMDFVVPVLTEGYFTALENPNGQARLLDERYIQFIHNILVSKYIHNRCLNVQVRPVIPSYAVNEIYNKSQFIHNPIFSAWKSEDDVTALADNILKSRRNQISTQ